ncbi:hypothetical protein [Yoonia sp.]|uniref:hypothetical protein n=1 Tax=Yoonia sp. TaxID=2212373 RepID=UPI0025F53A25|nr:hypothetical protein [Yoonia sp.]MDC1399587.1 hypothetical protein [Yoonia sp.]
MTGFPDLYFRVRDNGAVVFRVDGENRDRRLEFDQIAVVNTNRGDFKVLGDHILTDAERDTITGWMNARLDLLAVRQMDDIHRAIDQINITSHWVQSKATDAQLEQVTEELLIAMHDLRSNLVRKKADRATKG